MGFLVVIVILVFVVPNIMDCLSGQYEKGVEAKKLKEDRQKEDDDFDELVQKYWGSAETRIILMHICNGDYTKNLPEEIVVGYDFVRSTLDGRPYSFDFKKKRVERLHCDENCHWHVSPTKAMAEAINELMGGEYNVYEKYGTNDGTVYMELKPNKDF